MAEALDSNVPQIAPRRLKLAVVEENIVFKAEVLSAVLKWARFLNSMVGGVVPEFEGII